MSIRDCVHCSAKTQKGNGATDKTMQLFFKQISKVAKLRRGSDSAYFRHWWTMVAANTLHHTVADTMLKKSRIILSSQTQVGMPFKVESGAFRDISVEGVLGERLR